MKTRKITEKELRESKLPLMMHGYGGKREIILIEGDSCCCRRFADNGDFSFFTANSVGHVVNNYEIKVKEPKIIDVRCFRHKVSGDIAFCDSDKAYDFADAWEEIKLVTPLRFEESEG